MQAMLLLIKHNTQEMHLQIHINLGNGVKIQIKKALNSYVH